MKISKVRKYISQQISVINPKLEQWDDAFDADNIPKTKKEQLYGMTYSIPAITTTADMVENGVAVSLKFYYRQKKTSKVVDHFDYAMNEVSSIGESILNRDAMYQYRVTDDFPIQRIEITSQVPESVNGDDNAIIITLELSMSIMQFIC